MSEKSSSIVTVKTTSESDYSLNLNELDECIKRLKECCDVPIKKLNKTQKKDKEFFIKCVTNLEGTTSYFYITETVRKHFVNGVNYKEGTVGSFFSGCFISTNHPNNSCTPSCVTSFLPKGISGSIECNVLCIIVEPNNNFTVLNEKITNTDRCYIYTQHITCKEDIKKIMTKKLLDYLRKKNIKKYNVMVYTESPEGYRSLFQDNFIDIDVLVVDKKKCQNHAWIWILLLLLVLFLAFIFLVLGVVAYSKKE